MVEPAGATPIAVIRGDHLDVRGEIVVPILIGRNLELADLPTVLAHGLTWWDQLIRQ